MNTQPKRKVANATLFKVSYLYLTGEEKREALKREFKSVKSMEQWISRNEETDFTFFVVNRYALIYGEWEPFTTVGKRTVTLSELKKILENLEVNI